MKKFFVFGLMSLVLVSSASAAAKAPAFNAAAEVRKYAGELEKEKLSFADRIDRMWKFLEECPEFATNRVNRLEGYAQISRWCTAPWWLPLKQWDWDLMDRHYPKLMPLVLESDDFPPQSYALFVGHNARFLCNHEKYDEAIAMVKAQLERRLPKLKSGRDRAELKKTLVSALEWSDRFDEALAVVREIVKNEPSALVYAIEFAQRNDREDLEKEFAAAMSDDACFSHYGRWVGGRFVTYPPEIADRAAACVLDSSKPLKTRALAYGRFLASEKTPRGAKCLAAMRAVPAADLAKAGLDVWGAAANEYASGDFRRCVELVDLMLYRGGKFSVAHKRIYVIALANVGEKEKAARLCDEYGAEKDVKDGDRLRFKFFAAMMRGESVAKILDGCALGVKEQSEIVRSAGRAAQMMGLPACAQELAGAYSKYFTAKPERSLAVRFAEKPIRCIADWRAIRETLPKGVCDLPFGADVEALVTDVNTQRTIVEKGEGDNLAAQMEVSFVCDRAALHLFLRVADKDARKVEHGFTNGIGTEMYFAPGENQPYLCFGASPTKGLDFAMDTLYESRHVRRYEGKIKSEVDFSEDDYVIHFTFPWANLFDKLPKPGDYYKFDCIAWAPGGAKTWAGMRGIHHASDWGHLVFDLTPAQLTEIRRELILSSYKKWRTVTIPGTKARAMDITEKWDDAMIGARAFYAKCLKPFLDAADADAKRVTPEMDDAAVNEIFERSLGKWVGLRHEIDALRKQYLLDELTK